MTTVDLLVVGAHPDDAELGAGGLLSLAKFAGLRTGILCLTRGEGGASGSADVRSKEAARAAEQLGADFFEILDLPDTGLRGTEVQVAAIEEVLVRVRPSTLCSHYNEDWNPDHREAWGLIERSWARANRRGRHGEQFLPRPALMQFPIDSRRAARPHIVVDIATVWDRKLAAVGEHASQRAVTASLEDSARYMGAMIGARYGEAFFFPEPMAIGQELSLLCGRIH